jgi:fructosamine-3-kinase
MHRHVARNSKFGFDVNNTIGATFQPNLPWKESWANFWDGHRLGHMLKLTDECGQDYQVAANYERNFESPTSSQFVAW